VTALGGQAFGTVRVSAQASTLPQYPVDLTNGRDHVEALADRMAIYAKHVRENIDKVDADTADIYTEISREIDKKLWFLESHLQ
jgi:starvation-inducible DNA-binding protein